MHVGHLVAEIAPSASVMAEIKPLLCLGESEFSLEATLRSWMEMTHC